MKNLPFSKFSSLFAIAILVASCASDSKPQQKKISDKTQKEFEAIENNDLHPKIPSKNFPTPKTSISQKEAPREKQKEAIKESRPITSPALINEATDTTQLSAKNQERLQEINQNLAFFCMKHRKDSTFKNDEHCMTFTKKVLVECEKKHKLINTVMVNCIKNRLKKR